MYAQTEELRNPRLVGRPLAVTQKYLIVTCNYPARCACAAGQLHVLHGCYMHGCYMSCGACWSLSDTTAPRCRPRRAAGVTKLMATTEGLKKCPGLILVSGEDLTPYRAASKAILSVLNRFGPAERLGMDEVFVDVTGVSSAGWVGG
jgi:nucleotidyltransferase/DNA polymerase involved in DNA repair